HDVVPALGASRRLCLTRRTGDGLLRLRWRRDGTRRQPAAGARYLAARSRGLRAGARRCRPCSEHLLDRHRRDPGQRRLRERAAEDAGLLLALCLAATTQHRAEKAGLLVHFGGQVGQALRVLEVIDGAVLEITDVEPPLARLLLKETSELDPLLGGHARKRLGSRLRVFLRRRLAGDGAIALQHLLVRVSFPRRSLLEPLEKPLLLLLPLPPTQQRVEKAHDRSPFESR